MPLSDFLSLRGHSLSAEQRVAIDEGVRRAAYQIIEGKGATYYGVGSALARITRNILGDRRAIMTVCTPTEEIAGIKDVTVSLPRLVGGEGILETYHLPLNDEEMMALSASARLIRGLIDQLQTH
jgi:L-lactate dehydrogenase